MFEVVIGLTALWTLLLMLAAFSYGRSVGEIAGMKKACRVLQRAARDYQEAARD